jgi:hypothetical protein
MTTFAGSTAATISLVDLDDQGVCPDGHACHLFADGGLDFVRECTDAHVELDGEHFRGLPLIRLGITEDDIASAQAHGASSDIVSWARSTLADRPEPSTEVAPFEATLNPGALHPADATSWEPGEVDIKVEALAFGPATVAQLTLAARSLSGGPRTALSIELVEEELDELIRVSTEIKAALKVADWRVEA